MENHHLSEAAQKQFTNHKDHQMIAVGSYGTLKNKVFQTPTAQQQFFSPGSKNQAKLINDYYQSCTGGAGKQKSSQHDANGPPCQDFSQFKASASNHNFIFSPGTPMSGSENVQFLSNNANLSTAPSLMNHAMNLKVSQKPLLRKSQESHINQIVRSSLNHEDVNKILRKSIDIIKPMKSTMDKKKTSSHNKTMDGIKQSNKFMFCHNKQSNQSNFDNNQAGLKCANCGTGPLVLVNKRNQRLYTEEQLKAITKELELENRSLNILRDQKIKDMQRREDEISKLILDKKLLEEEKSLLQTQVSAITSKSVESLEFQQVMFAMCEALQSKLHEKTVIENQTLEQMEVLMDKVRTSNEFCMESRTTIEALQREVGKLTMQLQEEKEKNHQLMVEINDIHDSKKTKDAQFYENEALRKELISLNAELEIGRHRYQNLCYRTKDQEELFRQQQSILKSQLDVERLNALMNMQEQMPIEKQSQFLLDDNLLLTNEESYASLDKHLIAELDRDQLKTTTGGSNKK